MEFDKNLQYIVSTAFQVGNFETALLWLESLGSEQSSEFVLLEQYTPLHYACQHGRVDIAQRLITNCKCSIESKDAQECTPLHTAAQYGQVETLKYLLHRLFDHQLSSLTVKLVPVGKLSHALKSVFEQKLSDSHRDQSGNTPLHTACIHGQLDIVQLLTREIGCDPDDTNSEGLSCLHLAAQHGHLPLVRYLVEEMGGDVNLEDEQGRSPTYLAAGRKHLDVLMHLIEEKGADPYFKTSKVSNTSVVQAGNSLVPGRSLVHTASFEGHLHVLWYLVGHHGCDPSCKDAIGFTPLHLACLGGHIEIMAELIVERHCDPNCTSVDGYTCVHIASYSGHLNIIKYLVDAHHCDPLLLDTEKAAPLHYAAITGQLEVVRYFTLSLHCNMMIRDMYEHTPLYYAVDHDHLEVVKFFIEDMKYDPDHDVIPTQSLLICAINRENYTVAKFLIECKTVLRYNETWTLFDNKTLDILIYACTKFQIDPYIILEQSVFPRDKLEIICNDQGKDDALQNYIQSYVDPLHHAAITGDMESLKRYVELEKRNSMTLDRHGNNTLHNAAQYGQLEVVKYLTGLSKDPIKEDIEILCDPTSTNKYGFTAERIASQNGHRHVVSYLLRATTKQPVFQQDVISPPLNIFVVGNSGSGKSTLTKALSTESRVLGRIRKVKCVTPLTAGIVATKIHSQIFGKVYVYDFAGHEEYYASHEVLFHQTAQPVVLLTVDISLPKDILEKQLQYWLTTLSNSVAMNTSVLQAMHVIIIGSHADQVKAKEKSTICSNVLSLVDGMPSLKYHGFIQCDCRYSTSDNLNQLRQMLSSICSHVQLVLALMESDDTNRQCAALMYHLKHSYRLDQVTIRVGELRRQIRDLESPAPTLALLVDQNLLIEMCKNLSSNRHLLYLPHDEDAEQSLLVLDENVILSQVHACLGQIKDEIVNDFGVLEESKLKEIFSKSLGNTMEPEQAIQYLILGQFCTQIAASQLLRASNESVHYFFPNLVVASRPTELPSPAGKHTYTHWYTWCLKCTNPDQFFTHRLLHILFIQLVKCEGDRASTDYSIWKNGILLLHNNGTRSIIEVTDQTTRVYLAVQSIVGCESHLVKQRSMLISLVKSLARKTCPAVATEEFLNLPHDSYPPGTEEIPIAKVETAILKGHKNVTFKTRDGLQHIPLQQLIYFDSLHGIEEKMLQDVISHSQSMNTVPSSTLKKIRSAVKICSELAEALEEETDLTYKQLYAELTEYSIISNVIMTIADANVQCEDTSSQLSLNTSEPLTISNLYHVNVNLVNVAQIWKEFGTALCLKQTTLEKIKSRYLQQIECCFTEVIASWLRGEDRPHDSPGPNWGEVVAALKSPSVNMKEYAHTLMQKIALPNADDLNDSMEHSDIFSSVDNSPLDLGSMNGIVECVHDLSHKWFHLGLSLGLRYPTLKNIEASHHNDVEDHMTDMLLKLLKSVGVRGPPSWKSLALALNCPLVRENQQAHKICAEHSIID